MPTNAEIVAAVKAVKVLQTSEPDPMLGELVLTALKAAEDVRAAKLDHEIEREIKKMIARHT